MRSMAIDMGNTRTKVGLFSDYKLESVAVDPGPAGYRSLVSSNNIEQVIICSVSSDLETFEVDSGLSQVLKLTSTTPIPIRNSYHTPDTLGMDRLAGAIGGWQLSPGQNCLVIDAGTTITYDIVNHHQEYLGGGISPGIDLRFKALNQHTFKLPRLENQASRPVLVGQDTNGSIQSGVLNGAVAEIEGIIRSYKHKFPNLRVIMCGGDASYLETMLEAPIVLEPHLVLIGLNSILMYHAQNK